MTCVSSTDERAPDASASLVSGCTIKMACCQARTNLAKSTRSTRSVFVHAGRFTWRLRMISCCRKRAFSATSSDLLRLRSARVCSGKENVSGFVQRAKRDKSACQQPSFNCRRWVKTPVIQEASPSRESVVVRAWGCCRRRLILHRPSCVCKQGKEIFLPLEVLVFERMT